MSAQDVAQTMAALAADRQGQMIVPGVVFGDRGARFHEIGHDARIDDRDFGDRMRFGECRLGRLLVADRNVEQHVAGMIGPNLRRALLHGIGEADHRRQRRPFDVDRLDRVAGVVDRVGDDEGDGVADMAHFILRQDRIGRTGERIDFKVEQARQVAETADIGRRQNHADARKPTGLADIDRELRMRMRRTQHQRMHRRLRRDVVGIAALAANERIVFLAAHALTDAKLDGSCHRISNCGRYFGAILQRLSLKRKPLSGVGLQLAGATRQARRFVASSQTKKPRRCRGLMTRDWLDCSISTSRRPDRRRCS